MSVRLLQLRGPRNILVFQGAYNDLQQTVAFQVLLLCDRLEDEDLVQRHLLEIRVVVYEVLNVLDKFSVYEVLATDVNDRFRNTRGAHEYLEFFFRRAQVLQKLNVRHQLKFL